MIENTGQNQKRLKTGTSNYFRYAAYAASKSQISCSVDDFSLVEFVFFAPQASPPGEVS